MQVRALNGVSKSCADITSSFKVPLLGSLILGMLTQLAVPLPFFPVPFTFQTMAIFFMASLWGSKKAMLAMIFYLIEGVLGLKFFAGGVGLAALLGPTGGYLLAFPFAAYFAGYILENGKTLSRLILAFIAIGLLINGAGAFHLSSFIGMSRAFTCGFMIFLPIDALKMILALALLKRIRQF